MSLYVSDTQHEPGDLTHYDTTIYTISSEAAGGPVGVVRQWQDNSGSCYYETRDIGGEPHPAGSRRDQAFKLTVARHLLVSCIDQ